jgi:hypothetical protein
VYVWTLAATGSVEVADALRSQGIDGTALNELRRILARDEGLFLRVLKEDVGIMQLGQRLRLAAALRGLWAGE